MKIELEERIITVEGFDLETKKPLPRQANAWIFQWRGHEMAAVSLTEPGWWCIAEPKSGFGVMLPQKSFCALFLIKAFLAGAGDALEAQVRALKVDPTFAQKSSFPFSPTAVTEALQKHVQQN